MLFYDDAGPLLHRAEPGLMQALFGEFFLHPLYLFFQQAREDQGPPALEEPREIGQEREDRLERRSSME